MVRRWENIKDWILNIKLILIHGRRRWGGGQWSDGESPAVESGSSARLWYLRTSTRTHRLWNMQQGQVRRLFGIFEYLRYSKQRTVKSEKLILIFEISVSAQQPSNIVPKGQCWIGACFTVRLFSIVGIFSCSYWPVLGSHNMMLTFFSLFTSFLLVSCVRSSVNRPPPVCFVFVENFSLTGNDDPSQTNQQVIFVLFPHF